MKIGKQLFERSADGVDEAAVAHRLRELGFDVGAAGVPDGAAADADEAADRVG